MNRLIQVFKTGTHTDSAGILRTFTAEDLRWMADNFDPDVGPAPLVKGHPATDDPAFGWASRFMFEETSGILYAVPTEVDPGFKSAVRAGQYRMISLALYPPNHASNPKPGGWYPRHIGFLGAAAPAVPGLKAANFTDNDEGYLMFDINNDAQASKFSQMLANAFTTSLTALGFKPKVDESFVPGELADPKKSPEYTALQKELDDNEVALQAEKDTNKKTADKAARAGCAAFTEKLTTEGKLTPAEAPGVTEILFSLSDDDENQIEFTEGEGDKAKQVKSTPRKILSDFLTALPKRVEFNELAPGEGDFVTANFSAPVDSDVSASQLEKHNRIVAYAEKHDIEYIDAISAIERGN